MLDVVFASHVLHERVVNAIATACSDSSTLVKQKATKAVSLMMSDVVVVELLKKQPDWVSLLFKGIVSGVDDEPNSKPALDVLSVLVSLVLPSDICGLIGECLDICQSEQIARILYNGVCDAIVIVDHVQLCILGTSGRESWAREIADVCCRHVSPSALSGIISATCTIGMMCVMMCHNRHTDDNDVVQRVDQASVEG